MKFFGENWEEIDAAVSDLLKALAVVKVSGGGSLPPFSWADFVSETGYPFPDSSSYFYTLYYDQTSAPFGWQIGRLNGPELEPPYVLDQFLDALHEWWDVVKDLDLEPADLKDVTDAAFRVALLWSKVKRWKSRGGK